MLRLCSLPVVRLERGTGAQTRREPLLAGPLPPGGDGCSQLPEISPLLARNINKHEVRKARIPNLALGLVVEWVHSWPCYSAGIEVQNSCVQS